MRKFELEVNVRVDIVKDDKYYKSIVQDIVGGCFYISIPTSNGEYLTFTNGEEIEILYYKDKNYIYKLKSLVIGTAKEKNIPLYKIAFPSEIIKIQRRNFVRVDVIKPIKYRKYYENQEENQLMLPALILDLSGGGIRVKIKEELTNDQLIIMKIETLNDTIEIKGKIVRKEKSSDGKYIYGINFCDISDNLREKIIQEVFAIMRKQRELV